MILTEGRLSRVGASRVGCANFWRRDEHGEATEDPRAPLTAWVVVDGERSVARVGAVVGIGSERYVVAEIEKRSGRSGVVRLAKR